MLRKLGEFKLDNEERSKEGRADIAYCTVKGTKKLTGSNPSKQLGTWPHVL